MSVGGDPRLCHSSQIVGSDVLSIMGMTGRANSLSEAGASTDPGAPG